MDLHIFIKSLNGLEKQLLSDLLKKQPDEAETLQHFYERMIVEQMMSARLKNIIYEMLKRLGDELVSKIEYKDMMDYRNAGVKA